MPLPACYHSKSVRWDDVPCDSRVLSWVKKALFGCTPVTQGLSCCSSGVSFAARADKVDPQAVTELFRHCLALFDTLAMVIFSVWCLQI